MKFNTALKKKLFEQNNSGPRAFILNMTHSQVTDWPELCVSACVSRGVRLGRVLSGLITPDSCNLQVDSREKSARFTLLRVSICRHYRVVHAAGQSASRRRKQ